MSCKIGDRSFEGPFEDVDEFKNESGVYAILTQGQSKREYKVIDIGESGTICDRVKNHPRSGCWENNKNGTI